MIPKKEINNNKKQPNIADPGVGKLDLNTEGDPSPIKIGFGLSGNTGTDGTTVAAYINNLKYNDTTAFGNIVKAIQNTGKKITADTDIGAYIGRIYENFLNDPDPKIRQITIEQFINSAAKNFTFGKPYRPPTQQFYLTTPANAGAEINAEFGKVLGVSATPEEQKAYYKALLKAQKKAPMVTSSADGTTVQTAGFSAAEKETLLNSFIAKRAQNVLGKATMVGGTRVDTVAPEQFSGEFIKAVNVVKAYSDAYGVLMSDSDVKRAAIIAITSPSGIEGQQEKIKGISKGIYSGLASFIDQGLTPKELLQPYIAKKAQVLEIPENQITLNGTEGQQVISKVVTKDGLLPIYNYERELRADPRWRFTKNANDEAANWVSSIMKSFGIAG